VKLPFDPYDFFGYLASGSVVLIGMERVLGFPRVLGTDLKPVDIAALILATYIAGHVVAGLASTFIEDLLVGRILSRPSVNLLRSRRWVRSIFFPSFFTPLPEPIRQRVLDRAAGEGINGPGESLFLHVRFSAATLANKNLMARMRTFLNGYGLSRNLSLAFLLVAAAVAVKMRLGHPVPPEMIRDGIIALVVGLLFLYRFLKFYRQYAFEMFNVYAGRS